MSTLAWVHVSDWHQRGAVFERAVVRDHLLRDVIDRASIDVRLEQLDLIAFTGDVAFSGQPPEYAAVRQDLVTPLLEATQLSADRLFLIPGNHDLDLEIVAMFSQQHFEGLTDEAAISNLMSNRQKLRMLLAPFAEYEEFARSVANFEPDERPAYSFSRRFEVRDAAVRVVCLNSALFSGRSRNGRGQIDDQGALFVGQPQVRPLLTSDVPVDLQILLMHHPISWCSEIEQAVLRRQLASSFDFVLHGHEHVPDVRVTEQTSGRSITIPAGASFDHSTNVYSHSYNYVVVDLEQGTGVVHLRRWSEVQRAWVSDTEVCPTGRFEFRLENREPASEPAMASTRGDHPRRRQSALDRYRRQVQRHYSVADHRGIAGVPGSPLAAALPADDLYVVPRLVPADRSETREREHELLRMLEDQDISSADRVRFEEEYAAITGQQWRPRTVGETAMSLGAALRENTHVVLLGSPGVGKSALTRFLARICAGEPAQMEERLGWHEDLVPVLQPLAAYADARNERPGLTLRQFTLERLHEKGGDDLVDAIQERMEHGGCLMLFDGIDEIPDSGARASLVQEVDAFLADHPLLRTVVTSRPYGYIRLAGTIPHYQLPNFSADEVAEFVVKYHRTTERHIHPATPDFAKADEDARALLAEIRQNQRVSELATNPLMLVIIALIRYERAHLIEERVQLYHRAVTTLVDTWAQWRAAAGGETRRELIPHDRVLRVWAAVADWMHRTRPTGVVHRLELVRELTRVIEERGFDADEQASDLAEKFFEVVAGSGLLEQRAQDIFAFWHPTFEEFLAAVHLCTPTAEAGRTVLALRHDPRWREVILLSVGYVGLVLLDGDTATELVGGLWQVDVPAQDAFLHECLALAAAAVAEYPGIRRDAADQLLLEFATLLSEQAGNRTLIDGFGIASGAVSRLVPSAGLLDNLRGLMQAHHWRIRMEVARLAANAAAAGRSDGLELCRQLVQDSDLDVRAYAALGLLRSGATDIDTWNMVLVAYRSSFAGIEATLARFVETLEQAELERLARASDVYLPNLVAVARRAGRLTDSVRSRVRERLDELRELNLEWYVELVELLDEPITSLSSLSQAEVRTLTAGTRITVALQLMQHDGFARDATAILLDAIGSGSIGAGDMIAALRALPADDVDGGKLGAALDRNRHANGEMLEYAVREGLQGGTRLHQELLTHWLAGDEEAVLLALRLVGENTSHEVLRRLADPSTSPQARVELLQLRHQRGEDLSGARTTLREVLAQVGDESRVIVAQLLNAVSDDGADRAAIRASMSETYAKTQAGDALEAMLAADADADEVWAVIEAHGPPTGVYDAISITRMFLDRERPDLVLALVQRTAAALPDEPYLGRVLARMAIEAAGVDEALAARLPALARDERWGSPLVRGILLLELEPRVGLRVLAELLDLPVPGLPDVLPEDLPAARQRDAWHAIAVALWSKTDVSYLEDAVRREIVDWFDRRARTLAA